MLGHGEEGINKILLGAARVLYFFPMKSRVQPYAGGGAGIHNTRAFSPIVVFPSGGQPMVASGSGTGTRAGVSASAGARLTLTHALAIDPSVMLFKSADQTLTRISVGVAYQW